MRKLVFVVVVLALVVWGSGCIYAPFDLGLGELGKVSEVVLQRSTGQKKLVLLRIDGEISDHGGDGGLLGSAPSTVEHVKTVLELARSDEDVVGLLVRINSPGGGVTASDMIYNELLRWRKDTGHPVVAYCMDTAASGGYYVAVAADRVVCAPTCITGSIGVIAMFPNVHGLAEKVGVQVHTIKSGANKDIGSPFRPFEDKDRALLSAMVQHIHERFVRVVETARKGKADQLNLARIRTLADGRVFTAQEALAEGLVDRIGYMDQAIRDCKKLAGVSKASVVAYEPKALASGPRNIYSEARAAAPLNIQTRASDQPLVRLEVGGSRGRSRSVFQYLWLP